MREANTVSLIKHTKVSATARLRVYLNDIYAGIQVDGSFCVLAVLLILVRVEDVGAIGELRQVEVPPFEHLQSRARWRFISDNL